MELLCWYEIGIKGYLMVKKIESGGIVEIGLYVFV